MNRLKIVLALLIVVAVVVASLVIINQGGEPERGDLSQVSVRMPIPIIEAGQTPFYVAADLGFYEEEGIQVEFDMGSKELNPIKMVASGANDFGIIGGPDTLLVARAAGQDLVAIAVLHRHSNFTCLVTLKESGITDLEQLDGNRVGFFYGHISTDVLRSLFQDQGIEVEEVDVGFDYNPLITGRVSASWAFTVTAGLDLPHRGVPINIIHTEDYGIITDGYTIFTRREVIESEPDKVLAFLRATLRGVSYTVANPEGALDSLLNRDDSLDREHNLNRLNAYNGVTSDSDQYSPGYMDSDMFVQAYQRLKKDGVLASEIDPSQAFTLEFLEKVRDEP